MLALLHQPIICMLRPVCCALCTLGQMAGGAECMTHGLSYLPPSLGLLWNRALLRRPDNRGLVHWGFWRYTVVTLNVNTPLMLACLTLFRMGIVALSPDSPICTLLYIFLRKVPKKR